MENPDLVDPNDDLTVLSCQIKNVSARTYMDVYGSVVYTWKPGETMILEEQQEPPREKNFGHRVIPPRDAIANRKLKGKGLKSAKMVTAQGGKLDEVWAFLKKKPGNPLVRLKGDGKDAAREKWAIQAHSAHALKTARYQVDQWLKICRDDVANGNPVQDKPEYVFQAEQDIILFSRNVNEKRFKVTLDGSKFDSREECEKHIRHTPWLSQHAGVWQNYVQDLRGNDMLEPSAPAESIRAASDVEVSTRIVHSEPSAAAKKVIRLAAQSGKELDPALLARIDDPDDETALEDAMNAIMAPQSREEKARAKAYAKAQEAAA